MNLEKFLSDWIYDRSSKTKFGQYYIVELNKSSVLCRKRYVGAVENIDIVALKDETNNIYWSNDCSSDMSVANKCRNGLNKQFVLVNINRLSSYLDITSFSVIDKKSFDSISINLIDIDGQRFLVDHFGIHGDLSIKDYFNFEDIGKPETSNYFELFKVDNNINTIQEARAFFLKDVKLNDSSYIRHYYVISEVEAVDTSIDYHILKTARTCINPVAYNLHPKILLDHRFKNLITYADKTNINSYGKWSYGEAINSTLAAIKDTNKDLLPSYCFTDLERYCRILIDYKKANDYVYDRRYKGSEELDKIKVQYIEYWNSVAGDKFFKSSIQGCGSWYSLQQIERQKFDFNFPSSREKELDRTKLIKLTESLSQKPKKGNEYLYCPTYLTQIDSIPHGSHVKCYKTPDDRRSKMCEVSYKGKIETVFWTDLRK